MSLNHPEVDLGPSKYGNGLRDVLWVPPVVSKQGWTVTWKRGDFAGTEASCLMCHGSRFCHRQNAFGKVETRPCPVCHGRGIKFYERTEISKA